MPLRLHSTSIGMATLSPTELPASTPLPDAEDDADCGVSAVAAPMGSITEAARSRPPAIQNRLRILHTSPGDRR
jgi:hypothetical protein